MAGGDSKGGSDLDVFEGLGKKNTSRAPASAPRTSVPPPPPSLRNAEAQKKATLLGIPQAATAKSGPGVPPQTATLPSATAVPFPSNAPSNAPSNTSPNGPPSQAPRTPPPPRNALPAVVAPPSKGASMNVKTLTGASPSTAPAAIAPPPVAGRPSSGSGALDMDWDEEEEATHVLDRDAAKADAFSPPANGGGRPAPGPSAKQTLLGLTSASPPSQARPPSLPPPPPQSTGQPYARPASGTGSRPSIPPPPSIRPPAPPTASGASGAPGAASSPASFGFAQPSSAPPPGMQAATPPTNGTAVSGFPYQQNTSPMAMPPRPSTPVSSPPGTARPALAASLEDAPVLPQFSRSRMEATALVRPQERPVGLMVLAGVAVVVLLGAILFFMPHSGQIAINVADTKGGAVRNLQISVDGKLQCESAPCLVHNLSAGSHTVKVEATGYDPPADKAVAVESGKDTTLDFALNSVAPSGGTGFKVAGGQPGEKLSIDDKEVGTLPQEIHDLTPGTHKVRVSGGERYAAVERTVTVGKDEFQDLGSVALKVVKGRATVSLATPGAKVFLVSGSDRRELPTLPMSIDLDPSKQWSLVATKAGYSDFTQPLSFEDGQAEKSFVVSLDPKTATASAGSMTFPPAPYSPPAYSPPASHRESPPAAHESHESAPAGGEGTLNMNSIPASSVVLDGKPIGTTPQIGVSVSAGTHTVVFVNAEQGFKKQVSVTVAAGETKKVHP